MSQAQQEQPTVFECWCGARGTWEQLFHGPTELTCGGTGELACFCGGDLCVCHNHGCVECEGCPDCDPWGEP